jgi:hypothetical protein
MPDIQAQTPDGVTHIFPDGTPPEVVDRAIKGYLASKSSPEAQALANPPITPQPLQRSLSLGTPLMDPQRAHLALHPEDTERFNEGMSMAIPEGLMTLGAMGPIGGIARKGALGYLGSLGRGLVRTAAGSYLGGKAGEGVGDAFGEGGAQTGKMVGSFAGGLGANLIPNSTYAKLPILGRFALGDEEFAAQKAAQKAIQREADIKAGLRDPVAQAVREKRADWLDTRANPLTVRPSQSLAPGGSLSSRPDDLISRTRQITIPGEEPTTMDLKRAGDLTQAPLDKLKTLAKFGDKLAQNELNRRLKN